LSGNVWEWTRSLWGNDFFEPEFKYPYKRDERENLKASTNVLRVLRGGSFYYDRQSVRCAFRLGSYPVYRYYYIGFRVVVLPSSYSGL
jgi:iron(II)-dependent oxidoreductase